MIRIASILLLAATSAFAQGKAPAIPQPLLDARKGALEQLTAMKSEMAKLGCRGEIEDCDSIIRKVLEPEKIMSDKGGGSAYPGDEAHEKLLTAWSDLGDKLAGIYTEAAGKLDGAARDEAEMFAGWFDSWKFVARGIKHLNLRRKFCRITPVMADWSGTWGGYLHGRYLKMNAGHPSTAGLGAHNEDSKLPGYTLEGAAAARASLGGGSPEHIMDSWLGSEYHRDPVFSRSCTRIAFGGMPPMGWWSCKAAAGGGSGSALADVVTFPGDGDTDIPTVFGGEGPNPLDKFGMSSSGTFVVIDFIKGRLKKPTPHLLGPDGKEVEILEIGRAPMSFVAKEPLQPESKYTVEVRGVDGGKFSFSFTTGAKVGMGMGVGGGQDPGGK